MTYKPEKSGEFGVKLKQMIAERGLSDRAFAKQCGLDPSYISKLLNGEIGEPRRPTLQKLVHGLRLESIAQLYAEMQRLNSPDQKPGFLPPLSTEPEGLDRTPVSQDLAIAQRVQEVRLRLYPIITDPNGSVGTLRVLGVNRPVLVDSQIYIDLNVLERLSCEWYFSQWQQEYEPGDRELFDRLGVGRVERARVKALSKVVKSRRLLVLGKPGSGKTTFLKSLAVRCIQSDSDLFADRVPLLVTLREFAREARKTGSWQLVDYLVTLAAQWGCGADSVRELVEQGRSLLLLDGLDEVPPEDLQSVLDAVQELPSSQKRPKNRIVITCRTQGHGTTSRFWDDFTRVEVADFTPEQADRFIANWFQTAAPTAKIALVKDLQRQLREEKNREIAELAVTPILLSLICAVFRDNQGTLPQRRSDLYSKGMRLLLERWQRSPIDPRLTFDQKEEFLATLALKLFEDNNYFPNEQTLVAMIKSDFQVDGTTARCILKAFETETGLLIERSAGYWSFSHLTLQEYFTASAIVETINVGSLETLATHITEPHWREVFLLTTGMLQPADDLLQLMKRQIDELLAGDEKLQQFLTWVDEKTRSVDVPHKPAAIRAFYFVIGRALDLDRTHALDLDLDLALALALVLARALALDHAHALYHAHALDHTLNHVYAPDLAGALNHARKHALARALALARTLARAISLVSSSDPELKLQLKALYNRIPRDQKDRVAAAWWQEQGPDWIAELQTVMMAHRNIGHDWQFSATQQEHLQQYDAANKLLVDCLDSDCYVSRSVRQEIEDTLLLPIKSSKLKM